MNRLLSGLAALLSGTCLLQVALAQTDLPAPPPPQTEAAITVGILPDRTGGPASGLEILRRAVSELDLLDPDLVVNIGDMIQGYTWSPDRWLAECSEYKEILTALRAPWYPTAGNHDTFAGRRGSTDRTNENLYKQNFAPLWYSYSYRGVHFVHLYSDLALRSQPAFGQEQTDWLAADLEAHADEQTYVFLHKPAWAYGDGSVWEPIHQLLTAHGKVAAVIAGHFHAYQKCAPRDGIAYYIVGAAGGHLHKPELGGGFHHYCQLTIRDGKFTLAVLKVGCVEPDDHVTRADYERIDANGSYGNRRLWVAGSLDEPSREEGVSGSVLVHLANMADEPRELALSVADDPWSGWRLDAPFRETFAAGEERDVEVALSCHPWPGGAAMPPTLLVHFPITDSKGRLVVPARKLRVPLVRRAVLPAAGGASAAILRCENWRPDYREQPGTRGPEGIVRLSTLRLETSIVFHDPDLAAYPGQTPDDDVVSDALRIDCGDHSVLAFPFAAEDTTRVWQRKGEGAWTAAGKGTQLLAEDDAGSQLWSVFLAVDRYGIDLGPPDSLTGPNLEIPFNLTVYDNDFSGYTDAYSWVRGTAPDRPARGTLVLER